MERVFKNTQNKRFLEIFEDICLIPHGSGNTKAISDYCAGFAKERGLKYYQDELNNVIIEKAGSAGYENAEPVILQGHIDMVCEKDADVDFDFLTDPLSLKIDGDFIKASGTTLGADDGVAPAIALSILDDDTLPHPPLYVILTTDEETGMYGAAGIDMSPVKAHRFISLDCATEGVFTVSCAGGLRMDIKLPAKVQSTEKVAYKVEISGLAGGHSGEEIHKGRLNAIKLLGKFLGSLKNVDISDISGGSKDNAIPVYAYAVFTASGDIKAAAEEFNKNNIIPADTGLKVRVTPMTATGFLGLDTSKRITDLLCELPHGVITFSEDIEGLVQTSLNLAIVRREADGIKISFLIRSSKNAEKYELKERIIAVAEKFGAAVSARSDYPAWEYRKDSPLRETLCRVYRDMYGSEPEVKALHAGLECGLFSGKIPNIDAVAMGPNMFDIHTPRERLSISSFERTYEYLCKALEELK